MFNSLTQAITPNDYAKVVVPYNGVNYEVHLRGADKEKKYDDALILRTGWVVTEIIPAISDETTFSYVKSLACVTAVPETLANRKINPNGFNTLYSWVNNTADKERTLRTIFKAILTGDCTPSSLTHLYAIERVIKALTIGIEEGYLTKNSEEHYSLTNKGIMLAMKGVKGPK